MKPEKEKTIPELVTDVCEQICNDYCKYPELIRSKVKDIDLANDLLIKSYCQNCPLTMLY